MDIPKLGIGIGLREPHFDEILEKKPPIDFFEIISENYMRPESLSFLDKILEHYPIVQHGVSLHIGSPNPLDFDYLKQLKDLTKHTKTPWLSDHLSWGQIPGMDFHSLLPLPHTKETIDYVVERVKIVQDYLEIPFALENISSYAEFKENEMPEWEFYTEVVERADVYMMLDVNNIYVNSRNHGFSPEEYYSKLPLERVIQIHLAGHTDFGDYIIDSHGDHVCDDVWKIYGEVYPKTNHAATLLEWDQDIPNVHDTWKEALKAKKYQSEILNEGA